MLRKAQHHAAPEAWYSHGVRTRPGIYVEILLHAPLTRVWQLTQEPALHQRWDLRFTAIEYLPRVVADEPQRFLYATRIGFGFSIRGTGESVGERHSVDGEATSSLRFASEDPKSLIREGSGYWRYLPGEHGLRFLTWYDYRVRFGAIGRLLDLGFRPLIGWATAWSFDCLRLWAETEQTPECSASLALVHAVCRVTIAFVWIWHGLVPKLIFYQLDEQIMLLRSGLPQAILPLALHAFGLGEIAFGLLMLLAWNVRWLFLLNILVMLLALGAVAVQSPLYLRAAFNPVTLNIAVAALAGAGWIALPHAPQARRCLRAAPGSEQKEQV